LRLLRQTRLDSRFGRIAIWQILRSPFGSSSPVSEVRISNIRSQPKRNQPPLCGVPSP